MNFNMLMILFGVSVNVQMLNSQVNDLLQRLQGDSLCQSGQVFDYPYNSGNIKICQNGETVFNFVGTSAQCHCPEETWNDNYSGRCITSCNSNNNNNDDNNFCQSNSGQIYDYPYNSGHVKICLNGQTVWNFIGTDKQCHCPEGKWNDNYKGNCIDYCTPTTSGHLISHSSSSSNLCQIGSGQIYGVPYNNGYVKICQNGESVLNYVGKNEQCHCPQDKWNDNYNGNCIDYCTPVASDSGHLVSESSNLCQIGSGQIFGKPYNNGRVSICLNGEIISNFIGTDEQCHCPHGTFNDNFTGQCINKCQSLDSNNENNNNLCQIGSGQIFGVPYNNGNVKICQNGQTVFNFVGLTEQCHCPINKWNDNYTGQCINHCH